MTQKFSNCAEIKMLVLDEADEMLNRGFKEQVGIMGCLVGWFVVEKGRGWINICFVPLLHSTFVMVTKMKNHFAVHWHVMSGTDIERIW